MKNQIRNYFIGLGLSLYSLFATPGLQADDSNYIKYARHISSEEQKKDAYKTYRFFEFVDPDGVFRKLQNLDPTDDSLEIKYITEEFYKRKDLETRPDTPDINEYRIEMGKRIEHCDMKYRNPALGRVWDIRAKHVLNLGIPIHEWPEYDNACWVGGQFKGPNASKCDQYFMEWPGGLWLGFEGKAGYGFPADREIPHKELQKGGFSDGTMKASVQQKKAYVPEPLVNTAGDIEGEIEGVGLSVSSFRNQGDKAYKTTYINTGITGDEIKDKGDSTKFKLEIFVYNVKDSVQKDSLIVKKYSLIGQDSANFKVSNKSLDKGSWIPIYPFYRNLPENSMISVKVSKEKNDKKKAAILRTDYKLPSGSLSDILLSQHSIEPGIVNILNPGIQRNGHVIKENPSSTFSLGDTLYAYFEIYDLMPDSSGIYPIGLECLLSRLPKESKKKEEIELGKTITVGKVEYTVTELEKLLHEMKDSLQINPNYKSEWITVADLEDVVKSVKESPKTNVLERLPSITLLSEKEADYSPNTYVKKAIYIPKDLEPGRYALRFLVDNGSYRKMAYREISLKKGKNKEF